MTAFEMARTDVLADLKKALDVFRPPVSLLVHDEETAERVRTGLADNWRFRYLPVTVSPYVAEGIAIIMPQATITEW